MSGGDLNGQRWTPPAGLPPELPPVAAFDPELLPDALRPFVVDVAERMQCPIDYPAVVQLVVLGSLLGRRVGIAPKENDNWYEVPNLWGFIVGRPAMMKSPVITTILEPVRELEAEAAKAHRLASADQAAAKLVAEQGFKQAQGAIKAALKRGDHGEANRLAREVTGPDEAAATPLRYTTSDSTVEKLGELLASNPMGLLVIRDELTGFFRTFERQGHEQDRAFYLETWAGKNPYTVDRIGRGTVHIPAACVSIVGGIQPDPLTALIRDMAGAGDDGLMQRFQLITWPDVSRTWRLVDRKPDTAARDRVAALVRRFAAFQASEEGGASPGPVPMLRFASEAQPEFFSWFTAHELRLRGEGMAPALEAHLAKFRKLVPVLALILHLCDHPGGPVSRDALARALRWADYLESHARRMYAPVMASDDDAARLLARKIAAGELGDRFTARGVYKHEWAGLADPDRVRGACGVLERLGWLRRVEVGTPGRPREEFLVNPLIGRSPKADEWAA